MNGKDLAECIKCFIPDIRLLFMSGYTANVISSHGILDHGACFIQKPFSKKDFARKVSEALTLD
jgi:FixJ family two-component response regulator